MKVTITVTYKLYKTVNISKLQKILFDKNTLFLIINTQLKMCGRIMYSCEQWETSIICLMRKVLILTQTEWVREIITQCSRGTNSNMVLLDSTTAAVTVESRKYVH